MNIFFWIIYYLKCAINIILAPIIKFFKKITEDKNINTNFKKLDQNLYLVKLKGTYFEMGEQYGLVMKDILKSDIEILINFIKENEDILLKKINPIIKKKMTKDNIMDACYIMYLHCINYIPDDISDFYKGISFSSQIDLKKIICTNFFFELMESHCILYSIKTEKGLLALRTLDLGCPLFNQTLVVYQPKNKNKYVSLGLSFWVGGATMFSEKYLFLGESFYDYNLGKDNRIGIPFWILFHKIMAEANTIEEAELIMKKAKRIGNLEISVSDCLNNKAKIYKYSPTIFEINHELSNNIKAIYSVTPNEKNRFEKYKNSFTNADEAINKMLPMVKSGELHIMFYYVNNIYISITTNYLQSYNNNFIKIGFEDLF